MRKIPDPLPAPLPTPETSKAWDDASRGADGKYSSVVKGQDLAAAMLAHSRKMERERDMARAALAAWKESNQPTNNHD